MQPDLPTHSPAFSLHLPPSLPPARALGSGLWSPSIREASPPSTEPGPPLGSAETVLLRDALLQGNLKERCELTVYCRSVRTSCERGRPCAGKPPRGILVSGDGTGSSARPWGSVQQGHQRQLPQPSEHCSLFSYCHCFATKMIQNFSLFFQRRLLPPGNQNLFLTLRLTFVRGSAQGEGQYFCLKKCLSLEHQESLGGRASPGLSQRQ